MLYLLSWFCSVYDDLADLADTICCGNDVFGLSSSQSLIPDQNEKTAGEGKRPPDCQNRYRRFCPVTEDDVLLKWHLLSAAIILLCLPVLFLKDRDGDMAAVVILAVGLIEVFLFLGIHMLVGRRPNIVYSQDSGVNYLVNMLSKRAWGIGLIVSGFFVRCLHYLYDDSHSLR